MKILDRTRPAINPPSRRTRTIDDLLGRFSTPSMPTTGPSARVQSILKRRAWPWSTPAMACFIGLI